LARYEQPVSGPSTSDFERLRVLVDGVKDFAIFMLDTEGRVATWSLGAERLKGYRAEEILGAYHSRFYAPEDIAAGKPRLAVEVACREGRHEEEAWRVRKDGSRFWASVVMTALHDPTGTLLGYGKVTRDLTDHIAERRRGEEERNRLLGQLRTLNFELEARVETRTAELQAALKEREVLLQEVHHRVKNNLQVISSLISFQVRSLGADGSREALEECQARVQAIALIHEQLYRSKDYARVPFAEYARSLAGNVFRATEGSPERIRLEFAMEDVALRVDHAIPCGLILNELVTNALRHAFPDGRSGTIRVELGYLAEDAFRLAVRDDGVGLPPGLDVGTVPSLGLQLVSMLAEQVNAGVEVDRDHGTQIRLTVPVKA